MENSPLNFYEEDLLLRLVAMGATPPVDLNAMNPEKLEDIVVKLPTVHVYQFELNDMETVCCDISLKGLQKQVFRALGKHDIRENLDYQASREYSLEAWMLYLRNDVSTVNPDEVCDMFGRWGIQLEPERISKGFSAEFGENFEYNTRALQERQFDLLSRLAAAGFIEPVDFDAVTTSEADRIINGLPSLTQATLLFETEDGFVHERFVNVDEFYLKNVYMGVAHEYNSSLQMEDALNDNFEEEFNVSDILKETNYEKTRKVVGAGTSTLDKQVRKYFDDHPDMEDKLVHRYIETTGGMAWLDYFKQDVQYASPGDTGKAFGPLIRAFKNWEIEVKKAKPELAFRNDFSLNMAEARLKFQSKLIQTVVRAGIAAPMALNDWRNLNSDVAGKFIAKIPMLPDQNHPGDWVKLFQNETPNALELNDLKVQFDSAGIMYDEALIKSSFKNSPPKPKQQKGNEKMFEPAVEDYKKMMGRLRSKGLPHMPPEEWKNLSLSKAQELVRTFDEQPSEKQLNLIRDMFAEERLDPGKVDINVISKMEATMFIDRAPKLEFSKEMPANPMTDDTKKELRRLIQQEKTPHIPLGKWNTMSEEEGRQKIDNVRARTPASEKQIALIKAEIDAGSITVKDLAKFIHAPMIGKNEINGLNMLQAGKILENRPASVAQKEQLQKLIDSKRIEPMDMADLTMGEASRKLDEVFKGPREERDPNGPATENQKTALKELSANKEIPEISQKELDAMTFEQATKRLEDAPATKVQKRAISQFVNEGKLDYIPSDVYANLKRSEASVLVQVGKGDLPRDKQPDFSGREYPASDSQIKVLEELREKGKIQELPQNLTGKQADAMIKDATNNDPVGTNQIGILESKIAQGFLPQMSDDEKKNLNRGQFLDLIEKAKVKEREAGGKGRKAPEQSKPKSQNKDKSPAMSR